MNDEYCFVVFCKLDKYFRWPYYSIEKTPEDAQSTVERLRKECSPQSHNLIWYELVKFGETRR